MTRMKLSSQDKKDLDKFTRFWALKSTQVIVQSRLGEKTSTPCIPNNSGPNWFNINIGDLPEVLAEAKRVLNCEIVTPRLPLCIEISLRTSEGDHMVLETWCLALTPETCEPTARIVHTVYNRMGILLKSLISITRAVPGYKLSRRQGSDTFILCYRLYFGEPQVHSLGEGYKGIRVGQICTPIGTLHLSLSYRTKMTISPTQTGRDNAIMLKSDHFNTNYSPKSKRYSQSEEKIPSLSDSMKIGAFADCKMQMPSEQQKKGNFPTVPNIPFSKLFDGKLSPDKLTEDSDTMDNNALNDSKTEAAQKQESDKKVKEEQNGNCPSLNSLESRLGDMVISARDDFILVDLKTPFATSTETVELSRIYREWQTAPPLQEFEDLPPLEAFDFTKQLESFESDLSEYDSIVQSFCQTSPNNN